MKKASKGLLHNINKRRAMGASRPKSRSTVSDKSFAAMKKGWRKGR